MPPSALLASNPNMVRLRLKCVMLMLLGSTVLLTGQEPKQQPLQFGKLPKTRPAPLTSTQPTSYQQGTTATPQAVAPQPGAPATSSTQAATTPGGASKNARGKTSAAKTAQQLQQTPPPPPPPPTPEQMPAQPPQVRFTGGLLTVEAKNSTLSDVLTAIRRQTGATLELPPGGASERVVAHLGPAQPREVIASLLNGSNFDYIILGSAQRPGGLDRIILTARQNQAGGAPGAVAQNPPPRPAGQQQVAEGEGEGEGEGGDAPDREVDTASEPEPEQQAPPEQQQQEQPAQQVPGPQPGAPGQPPAQQQAQPEGEGQQQVKTPEQLLRELQMMRQQQQQQQQNQGENPPPQDTPNQPPQ